MSRDGGTPLPSKGSPWMHPCADIISKKSYSLLNRRRPFARVAVSISIVLFALWTFSISTRVVPKDHQMNVDVGMLESYLAAGESMAKSMAVANTTNATTSIAGRELSSVSSSAAPILPSKAADKNTVQTKRIKEDLSKSLSLLTNLNLASKANEKRPADASSRTTGNVSSSESAAPILPSKASKNAVQSKRIEKKLSEPLSMSTNSSLSMVEEKRPDASSKTTRNRSTFVSSSNSTSINDGVQTKRVEKEVSESLSPSTNSSLSMVKEKSPDALSKTTGNSSAASTSINNTSITITATNNTDYDKYALPKWPITATNNTDYDKYDLPTWMTNYFAWHGQMRQQFPDFDLLEHDDAPKVLVKYCKWKGKAICGGLYDRMGTIPKMLYVANRTNRVLLLKWYVPMDLETFLLPEAINWTTPDHDRFRERNFFRNNLSKPKSAGKQSFVEWALDEPARDEHLIIVHREANQIQLAREMLALNETDTVEKTSTFGKLWHALFRPSPLVQGELDATMKSLGLESGKYSATHCRVRHPGRFAGIVSGKTNGSEADVTGLPWHGPNKEMALESAVRALQCTQKLSQTKEEPIFFYSDSEDLVHHLLVEKNQTATPTLTAKTNETKLDRKTRDVLRTTKLTARDASKWPTAHLDRQLGLPAEAYVSTFVDLYIAASARCISFGVGNFGYLAAKISGTNCVVLHEGQRTRGQARMWNQQSGGFRKCKL